MVASTQMKKSPFKFIAFVYILSIPFWIIGALIKSPGAQVKVNIPISALMAVCPVIAALIFTFREEGSGGVKRLLARILVAIQPEVMAVRWRAGATVRL